MGHLVYTADGVEMIPSDQPNQLLPEDFLDNLDNDVYFIGYKDKKKYRAMYKKKKAIVDDMMNPYLKFWDRVKLAWKFIFLKH